MLNWDNPTGSATGTKATTADKLPTVTKETIDHDAILSKPTPVLPKANLASAVSVNDKRVVNGKGDINQLAPFKYPWAWEYFLNGNKNHWTPTDINMNQDVMDYHHKLNDAERHVFENVIAYLTTSDILAMRNIGLAVMEKMTAPELQIYQARQVYDECLTDDHEVLTTDGWKPISEITVNDQVYTMDPVTQQRQFEKVERVVNYPDYTGVLHEFTSRHVSQCVTSNHRMPYIDRNSCSQVKYAHEFPEGVQGVGFYNNTSNMPDVGELTAEEQFLIALQADGTVLRCDPVTGKSGDAIICTFSFNKKRKLKRFEQILGKLNYEFSVSTDPSKESFYEKTVYSVKPPSGLLVTKLFQDWVDISNAEPSWARAFIEELSKWNGWGYLVNWFTDGIGYATPDLRNAKVVEQLGLIAGYRVTYNTPLSKRGAETFHRMYFTSNSSNQGAVVKKEHAVVNVPVYCLTVPSGFFFVKRNNAISLTGNSVHCYIEGTSVLTPAGWKDFRMVTPDTLVYQYGKDGKLEVTPHLGVTKDPFDGHLLRIHGENYESVVTPNHKCVVYTRSPNGLTMTKMTAEELSQGGALSKVDLPLRCTQTYVGEEQIEQSLIAMAIYLHRLDTCKGNDTVVLSFTAGLDTRPCLLTIAALTKANVTFTHTVVTDTHFVTIPSTLLKTHVIKDDTFDQGLQQVYGEAVRWLLGTNIPIDIKYLTLSVSVWLTVAGYNTCEHGDTFDINSKVCVDGGTLSIEPHRYKGFVYSVGVPSTMIVTRYKGKVSISGNTWTYQHCIETIGLDQAEIYNRYRVVPGINGKIQMSNRRLEAAMRKDIDLTNRDDLHSFAMSLVFFSAIFEGCWFMNGFSPIFSLQRRGLMKGTGEQLQYIGRDECLLPDTDVLTPDGWLPISKLTKGTAVLQYEPEKGCSFVVPSRIIDQQYEGTIYNFSSGLGHYDLSVTPAHRMVTRNKNRGIRVVQAEKCYVHPYMSMVVGHGVHPIENSSLTIRERIALAYQADGAVTRVACTGVTCGHVLGTIALKRSRKITRLTALLEESGYTWRKSIQAGDYHSFRIEFPISDVKYMSKSLEWINLGTITCATAREILEEIAEWDGSRPSDNRIRYDSTNGEAVDKLQAIAAIAGYRVLRKLVTDDRSDLYNDVHRLYVHKVSTQVNGVTIAKTDHQYSGTIHCVTVDSGMFYVRRNGAVMITGNSSHVSFGIKLVRTMMSEEQLSLDETELSVMWKEAEACEQAYIDYILQNPILGYSKEDHMEQFRFFANRRARALGVKEPFPGATNALPWLDEQLNMRKEKNFFETRVTEYQTGAALNWD